MSVLDQLLQSQGCLVVGELPFPVSAVELTPEGIKVTGRRDGPLAAHPEAEEPYAVLSPGEGFVWRGRLPFEWEEIPGGVTVSISVVLAIHDQKADSARLGTCPSCGQLL